MMHNAFFDRFRCPTHVAELFRGDLDGPPGFFRFGGDICFGRHRLGINPTLDTSSIIVDALPATTVTGKEVVLPFEPTEVINNLRMERYARARDMFASPLKQRAYYAVRPLIPTELRWHLQRRAYRGWERILFPQWPVDTTVENIFETLWALALQASGASELPFIWYWPEGYSGVACMTHDVETMSGLNFCSELMDIDEEYGIKSSFQLIPEGRYHVRASLREDMRARGFEINVHDLNHDGRLFLDRKTFLKRAHKINFYREEFGALGFRSGMMYRNQNWYADLRFSYDMSVPNVAHLEPQQGGCCTVMPYFVEDTLVLPLTTTQDFALFHILQKYSTALWRKQFSTILQESGVVSFITHPDYLLGERACQVYKALLKYINGLQKDGLIWVALPREINEWWRLRSRMQLVPANGKWVIDGVGCERARLAYATLDCGRVRLRVEKPHTVAPAPCPEWTANHHRLPSRQHSNSLAHT